ncbi:hypothetical protein CRUP_034903 [Coryphaenoides rupestris]|nr:hypothetical protein CRUP_034903 [Coryphaenoides rupestris]
MGGRLVGSWTQDCTHLVMSSVKVTIKTICALLCGRLIVKREYFTEFSKALHQRLPPPRAESFIPEIDEPSLNKEIVDLGTNPERGRLFHRKTFVFFNSKQLRRLSAVVSFGGGDSVLMKEGSLPRRLLESPLSCVVDAASGSSQPLLLGPAASWLDSVKRILNEKGCRLITESEIGLAAIYASCDKYCNPSIAFSESDSVQSLKPGLLTGATLSQGVAVEETVLQAPSFNATAYVVNTESSQGPKAQGAGPQGAKNGGVSLAPQKTNPGGLTLPQKHKPPAQGSPQKQATLNNFFQPVNKKRPREDEVLAVESEPKRTTQPGAASTTTTTTTITTTATPPPSRPTAATHAQSLAASELDLFMEPPDAPVTDGVSQPSQQGAHGRKRKEVEEKADEIDMEELESIMSLDMEEFSEPSPTAPVAQLPQLVDKSTSTSATAGQRMLSKKPRVQPPEHGGARPMASGGLLKLSTTTTTQSLEMDECTSSKRRPRSKLLGAADHAADEPRPCRGPEEGPADARSRGALAVKDEDVSFLVEPSEAVGSAAAAHGPPLEMLEKPLKVIKQDTTASEAEEDLPKRLVLVEFKSLTVTGPPRGKPQNVQGPGKKNFKCFCKVRVSDAEGLLRVIRGADLLAHNRGKNSELDEWLQDAAEEERQSRQEESLGDDLFR